jgi:hypothetical protein
MSKRMGCGGGRRWKSKKPRRPGRGKSGVWRVLGEDIPRVSQPSINDRRTVNLRLVVSTGKVKRRGVRGGPDGGVCGGQNKRSCFLFAFRGPSPESNGSLRY